MRPTTKRRVIILAVSAVLSSAALAGFYQFRQHQINAKTLAYRAEGMEAFQQGDFARALIPLSKYNERRQTDVETLFAFGKARSRVEAPNNRHLSEAIQYFRRGLELDPSNMAARHELLQLYSDTGYNGEAIALADDLLKKDAKDVAALRARAKALAARRQHADALATSLKMNELAPTDLEGQILTLYLMSPWCLNKPAQEILTLGKKTRDAHPDDPRFVLIHGFAHHCALDDKSAAELYKQAAANPPADPDFVKTCTNLLDGIGLFDESQKLLERASADGRDPRMLRMLVQRLWQNGRFQQVVARLQDIDSAGTASDAHLLAYRAFSLYNLQRDKDAKPIVDALAARKDDDVALAWAKALTARFENPTANPRDKIQQYQAALVRDPGNAVIRYLMGEAYAKLGETELALQNWAQVTQAVPSWATPRVDMAYLLASTGRTQTAVEQAAAAYAAGQNLGSAIGLVVALATQIDSGNGQQPNVVKVLELAKEIQQKVPGEPQTLPIYVSLLARTGEKDQAVAAVRESLDKSYPLGIDAWLRMASVSRSQNLGLERVIMDHVGRTHGQTPKVALATAVFSAEAGTDPKAALATLTAAADSATTDKAAWKTAVAQFREHLRDEKAHDTWVALGDEFPNDISVQSIIVDLPDTSTAWADRPFIDRTIQRLKSLTGDQGYHWQLAKGRWLLASAHRDRDSSEAVVILSDIVRGSPSLVIPRVYLARAMENVGNTAAAIEQLRAAAEMDRDNTAAALDLVRLYQAEGKFAEAKVYLDRAARGAVDPRSRQRLAQYYARQGDLDAAVKVLGTAADSTGDTASVALAADLFRRRGNFDQATKLYDQLVARPDVDVSVIAGAADFYASRGKMDQARAALDRLAQLKLNPGYPEMVQAEFHDKHGKKSDAAALYQKAVDAAPTDPLVWHQLAAFQMRQSQFDKAAATCDAALAKIPNNEDLTSLKNQAIALRATGEAGAGNVDTEALIAELSRDPRNAAARDSLAVYNETRRNKDPLDRAVVKMRRVADQYPQFLPVQTQVVRMYLQLGDPAKAIAVAARAMEQLPNDPEPAALATAVYSGVNKWTDALKSAREWRRRSLENPMQPDVSIARALIELRQPSEAVKVLDPYTQRAKEDPDKYNMVIGTYAHALIIDGRDADAAEVLKPHLARSEDWCVSSVRLAKLIRTAAPTARWIETVAAAAPADSLKANYEVANAWYAAAMKFNDKSYFARAKQSVAPLAQRKDATAAVQLLAGSIAENTGDADAAIESYRKALQLDPKQPLAQNNLAYLLLTRGGNLDEARTLAEQAVAAAPNDASYYDTLANVYDKAGIRDRAISTYQKVLELEPTNVRAMVPTIRLLAADGKRDQAREMMAKLEAILQTNPSLQTPDIDVKALRQQL